MKKLKTLSIILLLLIIVGCGSNNKVKEIEEKDGYSIYKSSSEIYGFSYPEEWDEPKNNDYAGILGDDVDTSHLQGITMILPDNFSSFIISIEPMGSMKYDYYLELSKANMNIYLEGVILKNESNVTYNNIKYTKLEYTYTIENVTMEFTIFLTTNDNIAYSLQTSYIEGMSADYTKEFDELIKSFTFLK